MALTSQKINNMNSVKIKNSDQRKPASKMKTAPQSRRCLQNIKLAKEPLSSIIKLPQSDKKKQTKEKWVTDLNRRFIKREIHTTDKHRKNDQSQLVRREILKTSARPPKRLKLQNATASQSSGEDIEQLELSSTPPGCLNQATILF